MGKNYSGSDLSREDKRMLSSNINKVKKILSEKGCTNFDFNYNFHYFSGFFTSKNGQPYYICSNDTRMGVGLYYRKVRDYKDYCGQTNNHISNINELKGKNF